MILLSGKERYIGIASDFYVYKIIVLVYLHLGRHSGQAEFG
jgi:hypothetical protein